MEMALALLLTWAQLWFVMEQKLNSCLLLLLAALSFESCQTSLLKDCAFIRVDNGILGAAGPLKCDTLRTRDLFVSADDILAINDSLILASNTPSSEYFIDLANINSNSLIGRYIRKGNGPGEALNCRSVVSGRVIYVNDFVKCQLHTIDIDSILNNANVSISCYEYSRGKAVPNISGQGDSIYFLNPNCLEYKRFSTGKPRYFIKKRNETITDTEYEHALQTYNVSQGHLIIKPGTDTVAFASLYYPFIEFYSSPQSPFLRICFPSNNSEKYQVDGSEICFKDYVHYTFTGIACDSNYIYAAYVDDILIPGRKGLESFSTIIIKMNWKGDILDCKSFPYCIRSLSKTDSFLYGMVKDEGQPLLYRFELP